MLLRSNCGYWGRPSKNCYEQYSLPRAGLRLYGTLRRKSSRLRFHLNSKGNIFRRGFHFRISAPIVQISAMIPVTSTVHTRRSDADLRVRVMPFAARPSPAQGANNSAPPGFTTNTSTTWTSSPELSKVWLNGDVFVPSLVPEGYKVSPRHTFVPLVGCQSDTKSFFYFVEPSRHIDDETPPTSPSETKKLSPTHTVQTMTTVDSYLSSRSFTSTPDANRKSFPYLPMRSREGDKELSSLQRARWVPPRSIDVCRVRNDSDRDSPSSLSGLSGSYSARSLSSPQCRKTAILSPPRVEHDPIRKSRIKTEMCLHFINKTSCPFGANCTYAHGEEELQLTRLMDLHEAGLVDATTYRTVPCLTFVSTGSWYVYLPTEK